MSEVSGDKKRGRLLPVLSLVKVMSSCDLITYLCDLLLKLLGAPLDSQTHTDSCSRVFTDTQITLLPEEVEVLSRAESS